MLFSVIPFNEDCTFLSICSLVSFSCLSLTSGELSDPCSFFSLTSDALSGPSSCFSLTFGALSGPSSCFSLTSDALFGPSSCFSLTSDALSSPCSFFSLTSDALSGPSSCFSLTFGALSGPSSCFSLTSDALSGPSVVLLNGSVPLCISMFSSSAALASSLATPKINVAPTTIEAVPKVNFLIEYLFNLLDKKSNLLFVELLFFLIRLLLLPFFSSITLRLHVI
ncbi:hypothetical protein NW967_12340 [Staphylococcus aureus]|nr:hypothetical protein [Staphylococcus aureus]UVI82162.1 hypothetical protein NW967_12340 [Staphylococcus aureus]